MRKFLLIRLTGIEMCTADGISVSVLEQPHAIH
jgi:hypothetical protein